MDVPVPGHRPARPGHRRAAVPTCDLVAARRFFIRALRAGTVPVEVTTDRAPAYPRVLDELIPSALHTVERYANNPVETDHGRLKARLRPMRGLKGHRSARIIAAGHAFVQNVRRGHYELAIEVPDRDQLRTAFDQLAMTICQPIIPVAAPCYAHRSANATLPARSMPGSRWCRTTGSTRARQARALPAGAAVPLVRRAAGAARARSAAWGHKPSCGLGRFRRRAICRCSRRRWLRRELLVGRQQGVRQAVGQPLLSLAP